jgi:hypothetical protein
VPFTDQIGAPGLHSEDIEAAGIGQVRFCQRGQIMQSPARAVEWALLKRHDVR